MAADDRSDLGESCVCYIDSYLWGQAKLKVTVMSGTLTVGMKVSTAGGTHEYDWSGSIKTITVSGDAARSEIAEANVGDVVWVYGPSGETRGMFRGAYLISEGAEKVVREYIAKITYSGQMGGLKKNGFPTDWIALYDTNPGVPGKIACKSTWIIDTVKIAATSISSLSGEHRGTLWPGDLVRITVACWHPSDKFNILYQGVPIGIAHLENSGSLIKGIQT